MKKLIVLVALGLSLVAGNASADCYCACINNKEVKVCTNSYDANYVYCSGIYCN